MNDEPDITEVLRDCAAMRNHVGYTLVSHDLLTNAADEIERLRAIVDDGSVRLRLKSTGVVDGDTVLEFEPFV